MNRLLIFLPATLLVCMLLSQVAWGQTAPGTNPNPPLNQSPSTVVPSEGSPSTKAPQADSPATGHGPIQIIFSGGITGTVILALLLLLSFVAMALGVEHLLAIRHSVLIPADLADVVCQLLTQSDLHSARAACQAKPSVLAVVLEAGLGEATAGWPAVEKAMEQSLAAQAARLLRKIDYLSVIGNIAPMLGLLGTVFGMIFAFQEVADTQGAARAAELASGIYQALVTTVGGLIVAIPSLAAFAVFRNRVDALIAETAYAAELATRPLKGALLGHSQTGSISENKPTGKRSASQAQLNPNDQPRTNDPTTSTAPSRPVVPAPRLPPSPGRKP